MKKSRRERRSERQSGPAAGKHSGKPSGKRPDKRSDGKQSKNSGQLHGKDGDRSRGPSVRLGERSEPRDAERGPRRGRDNRNSGDNRGGKGPRDSRSRDSDNRSRPRSGNSGGSGVGPKLALGRGLVRIKARVDKNRKGFAFLNFDSNDYEDAFVPPRDAERFFHGDRVEATITGDGEVIGLKILERRFREVVGTFSPSQTGGDGGRPGSGQTGFILFERKNSGQEIFVPNAPAGVKTGDWVHATLTFHESGRWPVTGEITTVYGPELPASADIKMISGEYNLIEEHPPAAEEEARSFGASVDPKEVAQRTDLREVPFITIDGEDARDFDDAVYVERLAGGNYILWVAIADVSHYVREGRALDVSARSRGTSVYFPERAFHMLPRALSENLCSLRPDVERMAFTAKIEMSATGEKLKTELYESVIRSKRRATYTEIEAEAKDWIAAGRKKDWKYAPHMELYDILRQMRTRRGNVDFDLPEVKVIARPDGEIEKVERRERLESHRLIEEFMIAANEAVTEWALARKFPFIYRVHEEPELPALEKLAKLAGVSGIKFKAEKGIKPKAVADLVRGLTNHPAKFMLNMAVLRAMKQAIYSATHGIHFGLASGAYTHFTSPIRRYPDLVVHRMLRMALQMEKKSAPALQATERAQLERDLTDVAEHCSYRERLASDAERESIKLKQVRMARKHLGEDFDGSVVGMTENGFFVQLEHPWVDGFVHKDTLKDDHYEFNEERMVFSGKRKKRTFKVGDAVKVKIARADLMRRQVDFTLLLT